MGNERVRFQIAEQNGMRIAGLRTEHDCTAFHSEEVEIISFGYRIAVCIELPTDKGIPERRLGRIEVRLRYHGNVDRRRFARLVTDIVRFGCIDGVEIDRISASFLIDIILVALVGEIGHRGIAEKHCIVFTHPHIPHVAVVRNRRICKADVRPVGKRMFFRLLAVIRQVAFLYRGIAVMECDFIGIRLPNGVERDLPTIFRSNIGSRFSIRISNIAVRRCCPADERIARATEFVLSEGLLCVVIR